MNKKSVLITVYLMILDCLYLLNFFHLLFINKYINYAIGILLLIMLFTRIPFPFHFLSSLKDVDCLAKEQAKHEFLSFKTFFIILIPLVILSLLTSL